VLFASVGWTIDLHYCQGQFRTFNVFGKATSCHEIAQKMKSGHCKKKLMTCHKSGGVEMAHEEQGCCSNKTIQLNDLDELIFAGESAVKSHLELKYTSSALTISLSSDHTEQVNQPKYLNYKPPLIDRDVLVCYQVFRI
jgi:hypothetical protein